MSCVPPAQPSIIKSMKLHSLAAVAVAAVGVGVGVGVGKLRMECSSPWSKNFHSPLASLSLSTLDPEKHAVEPKSGVEFPSFYDKQQLAGTGLRKKNILGLKSITVYAFGVYVDPDNLKQKLGHKYQTVPTTVQENFLQDILCSDVGMNVRLVIVYGSLKMNSVRSSFEELVGDRIIKCTGSQNKQLLQRFTSMFKDEIELPKDTVIDITRRPGHLLQTKINGNEIGSVASEVLCRCLFSLYIGEEPFDKSAKVSIAATMSSMLSN